MKLRFKFSSDVKFSVSIDYYNTDENEILSRIDKCIDHFEFTFSNATLLDIIETYLNDVTWAEPLELNCKVIKNESEFSGGEITFDCEVEFDGNKGAYKVTDAYYEDEFYQEFVEALLENSCYIDTYAIYNDSDEFSDFTLVASVDTDTVKYSCVLTED